MFEALCDNLYMQPSLTLSEKLCSVSRLEQQIFFAAIRVAQATGNKEHPRAAIRFSGGGERE